MDLLHLMVTSNVHRVKKAGGGGRGGGNVLSFQSLYPVDHVPLSVLPSFAPTLFWLSYNLSDPSSSPFFTNFFPQPIIDLGTLFLWEHQWAQLVLLHFCCNVFWCNCLLGPLAFRLSSVQYSFGATAREIFQSKSHQTFPCLKTLQHFPLSTNSDAVARQKNDFTMWILPNLSKYTTYHTPLKCVLWSRITCSSKMSVPFLCNALFLLCLASPTQVGLPWSCLQHHLIWLRGYSFLIFLGAHYLPSL